MIYLVILLFVITASATVVKIGSVALRITGLDKDAASFQALSAFSGSGFTTSESELILKHPTRRRIIKILIILGNAGIVSSMGAAMMAFNEQAGAEYRLQWGSWEQLLLNPIVRAALFVLAVLLIYNLAVASWFNRLDEYGMGAIDLHPENPICGHALRDLSLTQESIIVLSVVRDEKTFNMPRAHFVVHSGDRLICYGDLDKVRDIASRDPARSARQIRVSLDEDAPKKAEPKGPREKEEQ